MSLSGVVPKVIAIFFGIMVAVALAIAGFNMVKTGVYTVTNGANSALSSVTGDSNISLGTVEKGGDANAAFNNFQTENKGLNFGQ